MLSKFLEHLILNRLTAYLLWSGSLKLKPEIKQMLCERCKKEIEEPKPDKRNPELQELIDYAAENNFVLQGTQKSNRFSAFHLLHKFGLERSKTLVRAAIQCRGKQFAPSINDFVALYRKSGDLANYYARLENERDNKKHIIG